MLISVGRSRPLLTLEKRQPPFTGGKKAFLSHRFQAKVLLIPFLRTLHIGHAQRDVIEIGGIKAGAPPNSVKRVIRHFF
jgi:hypothetical protein